MKEYICKEDMAINLTCEIPRKDGDYQDGFSDAIRLIISRFQNLPALTKADMLIDFAEKVKALLPEDTDHLNGYYWEIHQTIDNVLDSLLEMEQK